MAYYQYELNGTFAKRMISIPDAPDNEVAFISPCMPAYLLEEKIASFTGMTLVRSLRMY